MTTKLVDYAWARPNLQTLKANGVVGVLRYGGGPTGGSASKQLADDERAGVHDDGLVIGLVFESTADRAVTGGYDAGVADAHAFEAWAAEKGYPEQCPLFYAVDCDTSGKSVEAYFTGVFKVASRPSGPYGGFAVVKYVANKFRAHKPVCWQTLAWSAGKVSKAASIYQNGVSQSGYDTDVVLKPVHLWGKSGAVLVGAPPAKAPKAPKPLKPSGLSKAARVASKVLTAHLRRRNRPLTAAGHATLGQVDAQIHRVEEIKPT